MLLLFVRLFVLGFFFFEIRSCYLAQAVLKLEINTDVYHHSVLFMLEL
jgi:hypothetical protein